MCDVMDTFTAQFNANCGVCCLPIKPGDEVRKTAARLLAHVTPDCDAARERMLNEPWAVALYGR